MTRPPTHQEVKVGLDALRHEAAVWSQQAGQLDQASRKADSLHLNRVEAGVFQLIVSPYNTVVDMVANLTRSGHQAMEEIAATLRATAATYEREDRRHAHAYRKLY
jgi:hypothetical protein